MSNIVRSKKPELCEVDYTFTEEEQQLHSKQLAEATQKLEKLEDEKKEVASTFKAKIDAETSRTRLLSHYLTTGHDRRTMHCIVERNFDTGYKTLYALDGREVGEEKMAPEEYQMQLEEQD
jgi:uncharacterized protein (UPF0335 family)